MLCRTQCVSNLLDLRFFNEESLSVFCFKGFLLLFYFHVVSLCYEELHHSVPFQKLETNTFKNCVTIRVDVQN